MWLQPVSICPVGPHGCGLEIERKGPREGTGVTRSVNGQSSLQGQVGALDGELDSLTENLADLCGALPLVC